MVDAAIDIDLRPDVAVETLASVERDAAGQPRLMIHTPAKWLAALGRLVGQQVRIQVWREKKRRTLAQNRLLWGTVYPVVLAGLRELAIDAGEQCPFRDEEDLHEACKYRFLGVTVCRVAGEEWEIPPTTTLLSTEQFSAYVEAICRWAADKGIYVPPANERIEI